MQTKNLIKTLENMFYYCGAHVVLILFHSKAYDNDQSLDILAIRQSFNQTKFNDTIYYQK